MRLIQDRDGDHIVDSGEEITRTSASSSLPVGFSKFLEAGDYYLQVYGDFRKGNTGNTYNLLTT